MATYVVVPRQATRLTFRVWAAVDEVLGHEVAIKDVGA
jgi:hypothetical protein